MATLTNPSAPTFTPTGNPDVVLARASVDVTFTAAELQWLASGMIVSAKCVLFEQDDLGTDEPLLVFTKQRVAKSSTVVFQQQVHKDVLDEEGGPDEIFARFQIRVRGMPAPSNSPAVVVNY